jgi:hypothetical protein
MADKFEKFTVRARRVLALAQEEAQRLGHSYIGTEHLLLGLVREGDGVAARVLTNLGVELSDVRAAVERLIGRGTTMIVGDIKVTPRTKKVLELAVDEARRLNHHYIGTEHLLLGIVREGDGIAAGVLEGLGVSLERVRAEVIQVLGQLDSGSAGVEIELLRDPHLFQALGELHQVVPVVQQALANDVVLTCIAVERYDGGFIATLRIYDQLMSLDLRTVSVVGADDRGGHYAAIRYGGTGGGVSGQREWRFAYLFAPALDALARTLTLTITDGRPGRERQDSPWTFMITLPPLEMGGTQA